MGQRRGFLSLLISLALTGVGSHPAQGAEQVVAQAPEASWRVEGRVYATAVVGETVLVGGSFSAAVSGTGERVARRNLAAFSAVTGELLRSWRADAGSTVRALEVSGEWVFVGGAFGRVGGIVNNRLAKVRARDGIVDRGFKADIDAPVRALDVAGGQLWVGGAFTKVNGQPRSRITVLDAGTGALVPGFRATPNGDVWGVAKHPTQPVVYVSGNFSSVNGAARTGVAALSTSGAVDPVLFHFSARPTLGLQLDATGSRLFGAGGSGTNTMAAWDTSTGARVWRHVVMGDVQAVKYYAGRVWFGFHDGHLKDTRIKLLVADAATGVLDPAFRPTFDQFWGVFAIDVSPAGVFAGGDFTRVSGVSAQGWVRFPATASQPPVTAPPSVPEPPPTSGPVDPPSPPPPTVPKAPERITADTAWRFLDTGVRPAGWEQPGFDDSAWVSGRGEFGCGDGDERTVLSCGTRQSARHVTSYFRTTFHASSPGSGARIEMVADDGAVIYVNGMEVARDNMPPGPVGQNTFAASNRSGSAETRWRSFTVPASALRVGSNVVAVEVHQDQPGSSDLSFAATLVPLT